MINVFKITGEIKQIKSDRTIWLHNTKNALMPISCESKLKIEDYHVGEKVEVSGYMTTYKPLCVVELVATEIRILNKEG